MTEKTNFKLIVSLREQYKDFINEIQYSFNESKSGYYKTLKELGFEEIVHLAATAAASCPGDIEACYDDLMDYSNEILCNLTTDVKELELIDRNRLMDLIQSIGHELINKLDSLAYYNDNIDKSFYSLVNTKKLNSHTFLFDIIQYHD